MNTAPVHHHDNPDCEPQRAGYCVEVPSTSALGALFACEVTNQTHGMCCWVGGSVGFCRVTGPIKVWHSLYGAQLAAEKTGGKVVTVPRRIGSTSKGPAIVWEEVKA